jgi:hypothetical protein
VPAYAVDIALQYVTDPNGTVQGEAFEILKSFPNGLSRAEAIVTRSGDAEAVARFRAFTASPTSVLVRVSETDDQASLKVNGNTFFTTPYLGDSGWVDLTPVLKPGDNDVSYEISNGAYGGWHGRLEVIANTAEKANRVQANQVFGRDACPCNALAFRIHFTIKMDDKSAFQSLDFKTPEYL